MSTSLSPVVKFERKMWGQRARRAFAEAAAAALLLGSAGYLALEAPANKEYADYKTVAGINPNKDEDRMMRAGRDLWTRTISIPAGGTLALAGGGLVYMIRRPRGVYLRRNGTHEYRA